MIDISNLNDAQKEAVLSDDKKIMVIAGAGSGKTKVLTTRIARLYNQGINTSELLALTFTNKAAKEMKERIESVTGINSKEILATTFHSFASKILRKFIENLNIQYTKNFKIYDEDDEKKIYISILKEMNFDDNSKDKEWKEYSKYRKLLLISKIIFNNEEDKNEIEKEMYARNLNPEVINLFNQKSIEDNSLTFDELIIYLYALLLHDKKTFEYCQYKYILVDEYQDTDFIQNSIIDIISNKYGNIFVVGDDSQCIYGFRGANVETMMDFSKKYNPKIIKLEKNYRSTPEILDLANCVIDHNKMNIKKTLYTENNSNGMPLYFKVPTDKYEAKVIANEIKNLNRSGENYEDIAILYRENFLSRYLEQELLTQRIPYTIYKGLSFFQREEIKDLIAYIRVIADDYDNFSLERIINKPRRKIGEKAFKSLRENAILHSNSAIYFSILNEILNSENEKNKIFAEKILKARKYYLSKKFESIRELIPYILNDLEYKNYLETLKDSVTNNRENNIQELMNVIAEFEKTKTENEKNTLDYLNEFIQNIALYSDVSDEKNTKNKVKLMTIHASKGLEFNVVFLPALEDDIFPSARTQELEEERRLYYVAVTRAKKKLYISSSKERMYYGNKKEFNTSKFINESKDKINKRIIY